MVTGPGDQMAAAPDDYGRMRASRDDREQAIDTLKAAFVHGRVTRDELTEQVGPADVSPADRRMNLACSGSSSSPAASWLLAGATRPGVW